MFFVTVQGDAVQELFSSARSVEIPGDAIPICDSDGALLSQDIDGAASYDLVDGQLTKSPARANAAQLERQRRRAERLVGGGGHPAGGDGPVHPHPPPGGDGAADEGDDRIDRGDADRLAAVEPLYLLRHQLCFLMRPV